MRSARSSIAITGAPMAHVILPVSGATISLRQPTGAEDIVLAEHHSDDPALALGLVDRLATADTPIEWADLSVTDVDTIIVRLRQALVGDRVIAEGSCSVPSCRQAVDLSFGLDAYLAHQRPRHKPATVTSQTPGWFDLPVPGADPVQFRLPTLADQVAVWAMPNPAAALAARCIRPPMPSRRTGSRVEAAMARLAPPLSGPIQGRCPDCGAPIAARFEARGYCLRELRERARFIYDDIDALAERYRWSEQAILTLPYARRALYAARARQARAA
jgi:hypothetical protein